MTDCTEKFLTLFTPTYNRAHLLPRLYESLKASHQKNFKWLIIDDDSHDNTAHLVNSWQKENNIPIEYYKQPHGGKIAAFKLAVEKTSTLFFITIDSDDTISPNTTEIIYRNYLVDKMLFDTEKCIGYLGYNQCIGKNIEPFPEQALKKSLCNFFQMKDIYKYRGESIWINYVPALKKSIIPTFPDEFFVLDDLHHFIISHEDNLKIIPKVLGYYEYQSDGLSKSNASKLIANSPNSYALYLLVYSYLTTKPLLKIRFYAKFLGICKAYNIPPINILSHPIIYRVKKRIHPITKLLSQLYSASYTKKYQKNKQLYYKKNR